jgi:hypothetical protein
MPGEVVRFAPPAENFDSFWHSYPRKVGRRQAELAYYRAVKRASASVIHTGVLDLRDYHFREATPQRFIPHPTTWLNRDGWEDDYPDDGNDRPWDEIDF